MQPTKKTILGEITRGNRMKFLLSILAMGIGVCFSLIMPLMLSGTIDALVSAAGGNMDAKVDLPLQLGAWFDARGGIGYLLDHLWIIAIILMVCYAAGGIFQYLRGRWSTYASENIARNLRDRLYSHLQKLSYEYHVQAQTGDLIQRCTSDVDTIRRFLAAQLTEIFRTVFMVGIAITVMLGINTEMTLYSMILVPPLFLFAWLFFKWVQKYFKVADEADGKMSAVLQENLTGVRVVRAFGRQKFEEDKFDGVNDDLYKKSMKLIRLLAVYWSSSDVLALLQGAATLVIGVVVVVTYPGKLSIGEMTVFVSYTGMLLWPIRQLGRILSDLGKAMVSFGRTSEILLAQPEQDAPDSIKPPLDRDIEFVHVGFEHEDNTPVLKDVHFKVKQGQTVALLGATGSGKSTLMNLLQRLYDVKQGEIRIGGVNINRIAKSYLRSRVGLVLQEPFLYSRTVKDNIGIAKRDPSWEMIRSAAKTAAADGFINHFEKGYDTMVGERGVTLSGGQKQRVAIARTLLKENDILIFDDSLSAVDTETDRAIREALQEARRELDKSATTFIISHRLTTLAEADVIVVMQNGKVSQMGTHEELVKQEGLYKRIYQIQAALEEELADEA
ncbi:MAG: ABC transporter ATP-binding protein [Clostridiales bacterium]|nr:ABC transporter ATP-binding protein [Clostridiales bacterium]